MIFGIISYLFLINNVLYQFNFLKTNSSFKVYLSSLAHYFHANLFILLFFVLISSLIVFVTSYIEHTEKREEKVRVKVKGIEAKDKK